MKYFLDTEFIEGTQRDGILGLSTSKNTIDLISIGIAAEDGREYYAVSKDFNLKEAWNRYQEETPEIHGEPQRVYWLRNNVLKPIFNVFVFKHNLNNKDKVHTSNDFNYNTFKQLLNIYGKTNENIAEGVKTFCGDRIRNLPSVSNFENEVEFYGYYADYDWVVFCWLFGRMIDLPRGFPMYCRDLKQMLDEKIKAMNEKQVLKFDRSSINNNIKLLSFKDKLDIIKKSNNYPRQVAEHHALADANWNKELYKFINALNV